MLSFTAGQTFVGSGTQFIVTAVEGAEVHVVIRTSTDELSLDFDPHSLAKYLEEADVIEVDNATG